MRDLTKEEKTECSDEIKIKSGKEITFPPNVKFYIIEVETKDGIYEIDYITDKEVRVGDFVYI